jgi:outer membrane protein TolC
VAAVPRSAADRSDCPGDGIFARSQYRAGLIDFITLLQSEQTLLSLRNALASAQASQSTALVQLYLALGGGWQPESAHSGPHT